MVMSLLDNKRLVEFTKAMQELERKSAMLCEIENRCADSHIMVPVSHMIDVYERHILLFGRLKQALDELDEIKRDREERDLYEDHRLDY